MRHVGRSRISAATSKRVQELMSSMSFVKLLYPSDEDAWKIQEIERELQEGRRHEIEVCAYYRWESAGRPEGRSLEFWLLAEGLWEGDYDYYPPADTFNLQPRSD